MMSLRFLLLFSVLLPKLCFGIEWERKHTLSLGLQDTVAAKLFPGDEGQKLFTTLQAGDALTLTDHQVVNLGTTYHVKRAAFPFDVLAYTDRMVILWKSEHGTNKKFLEDDEILAVHQPTTNVRIYRDEQRDKYLHVSFNEKTGIYSFVQPAFRGCTATVVAMLALDLKNTISPHLFSRVLAQNLGDADSMVRLLHQENIEPIRTEIAIGPNSDKFDDLRGLIERNGAAILSVTDPTLGGHVIIVDQISLSTRTADIRDPWHGWAVKIPLTALSSRLHFPNNTIIQVKR